MIDNDRNKRWSDTLSKIKPGEKKLWTIANKMKNHKKAALPDKLWDGDEVFTTPSQKIEALANYFKKSHSLTADFTDPTNTQPYRSSCDEFSSSYKCSFQRSDGIRYVGR